MPNVECDRYEMPTEGHVRTIFLGYHGSDDSAIDEDVYNNIMQHSADIKLNELEPPMSLEREIKSMPRVSFTASLRANMSVSITLPGSNLSL